MKIARIHETLVFMRALLRIVRFLMEINYELF